MQITYSCPTCERTVTSRVAADTAALVCPACEAVRTIPSGGVVDGAPAVCLVCGGGELFVRKDFPPRLGAAIVLGGLAASCVAWYFYMTYLTFGILFATALADLVVYVCVRDALVCYRCGAQHRRVTQTGTHRPFELATHERHRQQAARLSRRP